MRKTRALWILATLTLLSACANQPPPVVTPNLPDLPKDLTKTVPLADPKKSKTQFGFAMANRKTTIEANQKILRFNDFYGDVREGISGVR